MSKQNAKNKGRKEPKLAKNVAKSSLEIGEELNIEPRLRPAKTGSVSQNTSKPIKPRKNNKKFATLMSPTILHSLPLRSHPLLKMSFFHFANDVSLLMLWIHHLLKTITMLLLFLSL